MSIPTIVILALNVLLAIFLLYGFLWGIGRGLKKSAIRFAYFIGFVIIAAIAAPFVSAAVAGITVPGLNSSLEDFLVAKILEIPEIADLYTSSTAMQELIQKLPVMIINIVVFVILVYVSRIFSWIGYTITTKIHLKKKKPVGKFGDKMYTVKDGQPVVLTEVKEKKGRWWGGLIGAVQGLVLLFLTLLPITGLVGMASSYVNQTVSAESNSVFAEVVEPQYTELAKLLREYLPADAIEVIDAYSGSIVVKIFGVGEFDLKCFDSLTSVSIGGERVTLRTELRSVGEVVENVLYIKNFSENSNNSWQDLDFNKVRGAVDSMFDSGLVKSVGMDVVRHFLNFAIGDETNNPAGLPKQARQMLGAIQTSLEDPNSETSEVLQSDLLALIGIAQAICECGIIEVVEAGDVQPEDVIACLTADNNKAIDDIFTSLFTSKTLKAALCEAVNIGTEELANILTTQLTEENGGIAPTEAVAFDEVQPSLVNWTGVKDELVSIFDNAINIYEIYNAIEDPDNIDETVILNLNYETAITSFATILDTIIGTSLLDGTVGGNNIMEQALTQFNRLEEVNQYFDLTELIDVNFVNEFAPIVDLVDIFKPIILSTTTPNYANLNYATISTTIQTLLNSSFLQAVKTTVLDKIAEQASAGDMQSTIESIITNMKADYSNMSEASAELMNFVNIACVFGESGAFDLVNSSTQEDINAVIDSLISIKTGQTETQISRAIGYLMNSDITRMLFVGVANNVALPELEAIENELGRIDKNQDWAGWETFTNDLKAIVANLIGIYNDLGDNPNLSAIMENPTTIVSNTNFQDILSRLGQILDKIATTELLNYGIGETAGSIYDNLLDLMIGDTNELITINYAKTDAYVANYWKTELENLAPAIARMNAITVGEGEEANTMLNMLLSGANFDGAIGDLSDADVDLIFGTLLDSSLLKPKAVGFVNMINEAIIGLIQAEGEILPVATMDTDLKTQKTQILNVVKKLLTIMNIADTTDLLAPENEDNVVALLTALKASYDSEGVFATAYTTVNDSIVDEINSTNNGLFEIIGSTPAEVLVPDGTDTTTIFGEYAEVANALSLLSDAIDLTDMYTNYESSLVALLNLLQTNYINSGIFADAYDAIEYYIINSAGELSFDIADVLTAYPEYEVDGNYDWTAIFYALGD